MDEMDYIKLRQYASFLEAERRDYCHKAALDNSDKYIGANIKINQAASIGLAERKLYELFPELLQIRTKEGKLAQKTQA